MHLFPVAKKFGKKGGSIKVLRRIFFCLTLPENSVVESFTVAVVSGSEKVWIRGGG